METASSVQRTLFFVDALSAILPSTGSTKRERIWIMPFSRPIVLTGNPDSVRYRVRKLPWMAIPK